MTPAILVTGICWLIAPFASFPLLLFLAALAGWFEMPVINVTKQAISVATTERERRPALAAYEVTADVSLLFGPPLGVAAMNIWNTAAVLLVVRLVAVGCGVALLRQNPPLRTDASQVSRRAPRRFWKQTGFMAACVGYAAAVAVLSAEELSVITVMHNFHATPAIGLVLAVGAAGAVAGGYGYGAISTTISPYPLLVGLGFGVLPCAFAPGPISLAIAVFTAGALAGAVFPASSDRMNAVVSEDELGEALGFHFSLMWVGVAMGSIVASKAIDVGGSSGGFLFSAAIGIGAGIWLGRIAARAAPTPGAPDQVSRALIVTAVGASRAIIAATARRITDKFVTFAKTALARKIDIPPDARLVEHDISGKKSNPPVVGHQTRTESSAASSVDSEAVDFDQTVERRLHTPWNETSPRHERKGSP
jgi:hypothetical protein